MSNAVAPLTDVDLDALRALSNDELRAKLGGLVGDSRPAPAPITAHAKFRQDVYDAITAHKSPVEAQINRIMSALAEYEQCVDDGPDVGPDDLWAIEARLKAATPGPWEWWRDPGLIEDGVHAPSHPLAKRDKDGKLIDATTICRGMTGENREANAQFIAYAQTDIAYLLYKVREAKDRRTLRRLSHNSETK